MKNLKLVLLIFAVALTLAIAMVMSYSDSNHRDFTIGYEVPVLSAANCSNIVQAKDKIDSVVTFLELERAFDPSAADKNKTALYDDWYHNVIKAQMKLQSSINSGEILSDNQQFNYIREALVASELIFEDGGDKVPQLIYPPNAWRFIG